MEVIAGMKKRIFDDRISLEYEKIQEFFQNRAQNYNRNCVYTSVMYQDQNPELAVQRDLYEKKRILPYLKMNDRKKVLDIGCGVGRWADTMRGGGIKYLGIDFSEPLLNIARMRHQRKNFTFQCLGAQEFTKENLEIAGPFDLIICAGIFVYLNDEDVVKCLKNIVSVSEMNTVIYIREPMGIERRLTLNRFYSEELEDEYSSIYRTKKEFEQLLTQGLQWEDNWKVIARDELLTDQLKNRTETTQYFYVLGRKNA